MNPSNRAAGASSGVVRLLALAVSAVLVAAVEAGELRFQHHFVTRELPVNARGYGDYGLTALVDVDRDGDLDICSKAWGPLPWNANRGKMHADYLENLLIQKPQDGKR